MGQTTQRVRTSAPSAVFDRYLCIAEAHQTTLHRQAAAYRLAKAARRTSGRGWVVRLAALLAPIGVFGAKKARAMRRQQWPARGARTNAPLTRR